MDHDSNGLYEDQEVEILDLYEYCHYVNVGDAMSDVMFAMSVNDGGPSGRYVLTQ